ncbi:unnamed protein product [Blepharisma stoltei]|uniref:Protein kinase domain-containing protein n=1 Tax=Blepharisma stoltei TaxID=1481888 RepID=A0AAU9JR45_9CILI|nr:unnamed protein product [Blepharisma stoltei]
MSKYVRKLLDTVNLTQGTYAVVISIINKEIGEEVAVKKFNEFEANKEARKTARREIKIPRMLKPEKYIQLKEAFLQRDFLFLC